MLAKEAVLEKQLLEPYLPEEEREKERERASARASKRAREDWEAASVGNGIAGIQFWEPGGTGASGSLAWPRQGS